MFDAIGVPINVPTFTAFPN